MRINLTTQTSLLTISDDDLNKNGGYLYRYFYEELENNPTETNIKTLAYNEDNNKLVLLIFDKVTNTLTQKEIT